MQIGTILAVHPNKAAFLPVCPFFFAFWILPLCLATPSLVALPATSETKEQTQKEKTETSFQKKSDALLPAQRHWQGALLGLLSAERYKPLDHIGNGQAIESPSLAAQKFFLGLHFLGEREAGTKRQPNFIYGLEAAFLGNLGSSSAIRKESSQGSKKGFAWLPADRLFVGLALPLQDSLYSRILLGRYRQPSLQAKLLGDAGSLTGLFWEFRETNLGSLRLILHKPVLAGDFLQKDATVYDWSWQERLEREGQRQTSLGQRLEWDFQYKYFFVGFYSDLQRHSIQRGVWFAASPSASEEGMGLSGSKSPKSRQAELLLRYTGIGLGFANFSGLRPPSFGQEMPLTESRFLYEVYISVERLDGSLPSPLKNDEGKYQRSLRAHVLRSGLGFALDSWFLQSDFFLPTSARRPQGSKPQDFKESGYIGFGKNPAWGALLRNTLDARPYYGLCFALPDTGEEAGCAGLQRETDELQIRRPSAVWNLRAGYRGEKFSLALGGSLFYPLALLESRPGNSPFQKLKKDSQQFSYREIGLEFRCQIRDSGFVQFRYNRLYRIRPGNPESPLRKFQNRTSSLAAEFFEIEFSHKLF